MDRPPPPSLTDHDVDGLVFNSSFDHANLKDAQRARDGAWDLCMAKDAENTSNEKRSSTWFYFRVRMRETARSGKLDSDLRAWRARASCTNTAIGP